MNQATVAVPFELDKKQITLSELLEKTSTWSENMEDSVFSQMIKEWDKSDAIDTNEVISYLKNEIKWK